MVDDRDRDRYFLLRSVSPEAGSDYRLPPYLVKALPPDKNARILDIGCGYGHMLRELGEAGYRFAEGVDVSSEAVDHCRKNHLAVKKIIDLREYCLSKGEPEFDFIIMNHVLEHIEKPLIIDTLTLVRDSLMKEGGALLVVVPNAQSPTGTYWAYEDFTHHTIFTAGSIKFVLKAAGFDRLEFLDRQGFEHARPVTKLVKSVFLVLYSLNRAFWNFVTSSSFHKESPEIYTFDIKVLARK